MIRTLRKKMLCLTLLVLSLLIFAGNLMVNLSVIRVCGQITTHILEILAVGMEDTRDTHSLELADSFGFATVTVDRDEFLSIMSTPLYALETTQSGEIRFLGDFRTQKSVDASLLGNALDEILAHPPGVGRKGPFRYYKAEKDYGTFAVIADGRQGFERSVVRHLTLASLAVSIPILLILALISFFLTRSALTPAVEALKKQKQFLSDAGHELKTPLSTITVNAAVLESETGSNKYVECIKNEAQRMNGLVRQMLDVACVEDPEPTVRRERFSLSDVIVQATLPFESLAFEQNIHYVCDIAENCLLWGDPERIRQVAAILLDNAFKYCCAGGQVSVRLHRDGRRFVLEVYNTGPGISREDLPHIFERFYRCDKARPGNGSYGLGLAIAKAAVEAGGGTIAAESEYGRWARFRVTL